MPSDIGAAAQAMSTQFLADDGGDREGVRRRRAEIVWLRCGPLLKVAEMSRSMFEDMHLVSDFLSIPASTASMHGFPCMRFTSTST
jgi:hypothetical protein